MLNKFIDLERLTTFFQGLKDIFLQKSEANKTYATKTEVENKVDKVEGKGLSTLDYNTSEKSKVDNSINQISVTQNTNNVELNLSKASGNVTAYIDEATPIKAGALSNTDKAKLDKFTEVENKPYYNGEEIGGTVPNLTLNELTLGGRFKISYNDDEDSLDIEVI